LRFLENASTLHTLSHRGGVRKPYVNHIRDSSRIEKLIVNGEEAKRGEYPWFVQVSQPNIDSGSIRLQCGGALINERWILSSTDCCPAKGQTGTLDAKVGAIAQIDPGATLIRDLKCFPHKDWDPEDALKTPNVALLRIPKQSALKPPEDTDEDIKKYNSICLPPEDLSSDEQEFEIAGTGTGSGPGSDKLKKGRTKINLRFGCVTLYDNDIYFCNWDRNAADDDVTPFGCVEDEGGPLMWKNQDEENRYYVV
jgi:Trypsin